MMGLLFGAALVVEFLTDCIARLGEEVLDAAETVGDAVIDAASGWRGRMRRQMRVRMQIAAAEQAPIRVSVPTVPSRGAVAAAAVALAEVNSWQVYEPDIFGLVEHNGMN